VGESLEEKIDNEWVELGKSRLNEENNVPI
jgi:hypothetical protein